MAVSAGQPPARTPLPRDHVETDLGVVGLVTDRGTRHSRNEDDGWVALLGPAVAAVVCDGVSSSVDPDAASAAAVRAAGEVLTAADRDAAPEGTLTLAIAAAADAVAALAVDPVRAGAGSPPACTLVATVARPTSTGAAVTTAWVGDSRAYWVPAVGPADTLTVDDSWAAEAIAAGAEPAAAYADLRAHVITRWLGASAGTVVPHVGTVEVAAPGTLCLCTDGLWNYLEDPAAFADVVRAHAAGAAIDTARALTAFAIDAGGADNVTVAVVRLSPRQRGSAP